METNGIQTTNKRNTAWPIGKIVRRLDPNTEGETQQLAVRLPANLLAVLDAETDRLNAMAPGLRLGRSDALRSILSAYAPPQPTNTPASPTKATLPPTKSLLERYKEARDAGYSNVSIAEAIGSSESGLRNWNKGNVQMKPERETALDQWLSTNGF